MFETREPTVEARNLAKRGGVALVLSVVLNLLVLQAVLAPELVQQFEPLNIGPVALFSALGAVGATVTYAVIDRLSDSTDRTFTIVALVVLFLSFVPDILLLQGELAATLPAVVVLIVMHVVAAVACIVSLTGKLV